MGNPAVVVLEQERWERLPASTRFVIHQIVNFANGFASGLRIFESYVEMGQIQAPPAVLEIMRSMERSTAELQKLLRLFNSATAISDQCPCSLASAIGAACRLHDSTLQQTGFVVAVDGGAESGILVDVPFHILTLALAHLTTNSIDAMAASGKGNRITIALRENREDKAIVECAIRDDGPGIDPSLGDVFHPRKTTKKGSYGWGLDLTRCSLLEHGTRIEITNTGSEGTKITLYLPKSK